MSWSACTTPTSLSPPSSLPSAPAPSAIRPPTTTFLLSPTLTASPTYSQLRPLTPTLEGPRRPRPVSEVLCLSPRRPPTESFRFDISPWATDFDHELRALELWFLELSDQEKTKSVHALLQHVSPEQARFFISTLMSIAKREAPPLSAGVVDPFESSVWTRPFYDHANTQPAPPSSPAPLPLPPTRTTEAPWPFELILPKKTFRPHSPAPIGTSRPQSPLNPTPQPLMFTPSPSPPISVPHSPHDPRFVKKFLAPQRAPARSWKDPVDFTLLSDIPAWLRSLRLHKYTGSFPPSITWREMIELSDDDLVKRGVAALGARNKFLKVFEQVKLALAAGQVPVPSAIKA